MAFFRTTFKVLRGKKEERKLMRRVMKVTGSVTLDKLNRAALARTQTDPCRLGADHQYGQKTAIRSLFFP